MKLSWILAGAFLLFVLLVFFVLRPQQESSDGLTFSTNDSYFSFINDNFISGGVGKDDIPAIDNPQYITAQEASIADEEVVYGVAYGDFVAAYPQDILYWHEIVNENVDNEKISVTYCPLTGSVIGYKGKNLGVSGKLYNNNLVMYDRETDEEIPQILGTAVNGPNKGESLATFPVFVTTWGAWKTAHPNTKLLTRSTGFSRDYDRNPYPGYDAFLNVWFPVAAESDVFPSKEIVHGVEYEGQKYALVKDAVTTELSFADGLLTARKNPSTNALLVSDANSPVKSFDVYWFAWYAYHPDTHIVD